MANMKNIGRKCPSCGGSARLCKTNGVDDKTYYCECEKCGLRTRDYKTQIGAITSWNTDKEEYFFYKKE